MFCIRYVRIKLTYLIRNVIKPYNMTAVEYLAQQYDWLMSLELTKEVSRPIIDEYRNKFLKKAKEMEREQKIQFAEDYHKSKFNND